MRCVRNKHASAETLQCIDSCSTLCSGRRDWQSAEHCARNVIYCLYALDAVSVLAGTKSLYESLHTGTTAMIEDCLDFACEQVRHIG